MNNFANYMIETEIDNEPKMVQIGFDVVIGETVEDEDGYPDYIEVKREHYEVSSYDDEVKSTIDGIIEKAYETASKTYKYFDLIISPENVEIIV